MIQFYTKSKAYEQLVALLSSWSDAEAVEGDYDSALSWLLEAQKYGTRIDDWESTTYKSQIGMKVDMINNFLTARKVALCNPSQAREICFQLLAEQSECVQPGDCYALLIQLENDYAKAYKFIEIMRERGIPLDEYIEEETIISIYRACQVEPLEYKDDENEGIAEECVRVDRK